MNSRLDKELVRRGLVETRSQAENLVRLGDVLVNKKVIQKTGYVVSPTDEIVLKPRQLFVSRAGLKLVSVASKFQLEFSDKLVLDIGSSTGGFTDFALQDGAKKVIAVDVGTEQMHPKLRQDERVELHEKTDIRDFVTDEKIDIIVGDVSFISLREILPHVASRLMQPSTLLLAMVKPQFEAGRNQTNKGVVKNDKHRRQILSDFEVWARQYFIVIDKRDSEVAGAKGNLERFYLLKLKTKR